MSAIANLLEGEQRFLHISASAIRCLQECARQFHLKYVEARLAEDQSARMVLGAAVHRALAHYYRVTRDCDPAPELPALVDIARAHIARTVAPPIAYDEGESAETLVADAERLLDVFLDEGYRPSHVIAVEKAWALRIAGYDEIAVGVFDLVAHDGAGHVVVVDHKTGSRLDAQRAERPDVQMGLYALAAKQLYGVEHVELVYQQLVATRQPRVVLQPVARHAHDEDEVLEAVKSALELIGVAVAHPLGKRLLGRRRSWMCKGCAWRRACAEVEP